MIKRFLILILLTGVSANMISAQSDHHQSKSKHMDRMKAKKIAYITDALELTPEESAQFWPIYNQFKKEYNALRGDRRSYTDLTEAEALNQLDQYIERDAKELELKKAYNAKFLDVISAKKLIKLRHVERKFKHDMLNDIKSKYSSRNRSRE